MRRTRSVADKNSQSLYFSKKGQTSKQIEHDKKKNSKNPRILISVNEDKMYNCKLFIQLGRKPALELSTIVKYLNGMLLWMDKTQP